MEYISVVLNAFINQKVRLVTGDIVIEGTLLCHGGEWKVVHTGEPITVIFKFTEKSDVSVHGDGFIQINL